MQQHEVFPIPGDFDLLMGFSLFTHLDPDDAKHMLMLARHAVRPNGWLFFSAFCDQAISGFKDRLPDQPLLTHTTTKNIYSGSLMKRAGK